MNQFGLSLLWLMMQISLLCLVAVPIYLMARRWHPRAGALTTFSTLLLLTLVTAAAFSPWPRWSTGREETATTGTLPPQTMAGAITVAPSATVADESGPSIGTGWSRLLSPDAAGDLWLRIGRNIHVEPTAVTPQKGLLGLAWTGWLGCLFVGGVIVALVRLIAGLVVVSRQRLKSRPITDAELLGEVDVLCAEIGCLKPVELRESDAVFSAATVGWRRPLILLPTEHLEWTASERRSVLAHEIAHIHSNDFICWVCAQSGLLLHFYHPLVHWLANRLRLEQELAADALAAECSGGPAAYVRTLAELALRQADRPVAWPARTFLPVKGTLIRRVEMLRGSQVAKVMPSLWRQGLIVALLLVASVVLSGIRPPDASLAFADAPPLSQLSEVAPVEQAEQQTVLETQLAQADARKEKRAARKAAREAGDSSAAKTGTLAGSDGAFNLKYVPTSTNMLIGIRPAATSNVAALKPLIDALEKTVFNVEGDEPLKVSDFKQVLILGFPDAQSGRPSALGSQPLSLLTANRDAVERLKKFRLGHRQVSEVKTHGQHTYELVGRTALAQLDDVTLVEGGESMVLALFDAVAKGDTSPSWKKQFEGSADRQACYVINMQAVRPEIENTLNRPERAPNPMAAFSPMWQQSDLVVASADFSSGGNFRVTAYCSDEDGAKRVAETARSLIPLGRNMLMSFQQQVAATPPPGAPKELFASAFKVAESFLNSVTITSEGNASTLSAEAESSTIPVMVSLLLPAVQSARAAAMRAQSMNNLRQIALALHNYHSTHQHFPAPTVLGPDGKTVHSWRVAILPFLDQAALYNQYRLDEPWDSEANLKVLNQMPQFFRDPNATSMTNSSYFALTGESTGLGQGTTAVKIANIVDGTSNTLLVVEAVRDIPWTKPVDIPYSADEALPKLGGNSQGGWIGALGDGSVRFISNGIDEKVLRGWITRNGGEVVPTTTEARPSGVPF